MGFLIVLIGLIVVFVIPVVHPADAEEVEELDAAQQGESEAENEQSTSCS